MPGCGATPAPFEPLSEAYGQEPRAFDGVCVPKDPRRATRHTDANAAYRIDFGPDWHKGLLTLEPPKVGTAFPVLVPQVDQDGNERDGVRLPEITVPLATYTGWNLRNPAISAPDQRVSFEGLVPSISEGWAGEEKVWRSTDVDCGALSRSRGLPATLRESSRCARERAMDPARRSRCGGTSWRIGVGGSDKVAARRISAQQLFPPPS